MALESLSIRKLFGQFDYDIPLVNQDGIVILTGPNGYGKTTTLNIIYNFFRMDFYFFRKLIFEELDFYFSGNMKINLSKGIKRRDVQTLVGQRETAQNQSDSDINLTLYLGDKALESFSFNSDIENKFIQELKKLYHLDRVSPYIFKDLNTGALIEIEYFVQQIPEKPLEIISRCYREDEWTTIFILLLTTEVYLIKEQRLLKPVSISEQLSQLFEQLNRLRNIKPAVSYIIQDYASDLKDLIEQSQTEAFQESQELDSSFPNRLMQAKKGLSEDDFNKRFKGLVEKQKRLQQFGITVSNAEAIEYSTDKADVLAVWLDDSEKKAALFDDLLESINLFITILGNKQLNNKTIKISGIFGLSVTTLEGKSINLALLSSGEQQEIVLLYELLFRAKPGALVLIDEPEISLHVMWQKEFVKDLLKIAKLKKISFCLATHSPQIVNGRWDLTTDLYTLVNKEDDPDYEEDGAE
jgi:predicted ATP-binding protein involved in virulence